MLLLELYIATVCLSLATQVLVGTGMGIQLAKDGYTSPEYSPKPMSIWSLLLSILVCFIPGINVICMYRTIKGIREDYKKTKESFVKNENVQKEEVEETKSEVKEARVEKEKEVNKEKEVKSFDSMDREEKKAYLQGLRDYLVNAKEDTKENSGPVLKKQLEPMRS